MKELPKYAFMTHSVGFAGVKVIQLEKPYLIAGIYEVRQNDIELVSQFLEDMAQERYPIAKVPGYTVFLKMFTSLEPCNDREYQQEILNEMAQFVLTERIQQRPGQFRRNCESGADNIPNDFTEQPQKKVVLRERRKRD